LPRRCLLSMSARCCRRLTLFHDVQRKPMLQLHTRCAENGTHRSRRATLLPNHFANVALRDTQSNDSGIALCDCLDRDATRIIDQSMSDLGYKVCHVLYRIFPCRKLRCLSHHTPSDSGVTKKRSSLSFRLVYSEIFQEVLKRAKHRSQTVRRIRPGPLLCKVRRLTLQYQEVYVKWCAGRTTENLVWQLSLGTIMTFPKLAVTR